LARQHFVITRRQALTSGLSDNQISDALASRRWVLLHHGVYAVASSPATPARSLMAACLAGGPQAVASHASAAWILGLTDRAPARPAITLPVGRKRRLEGVDVHRSRDLDPSRILERRGIPYTDALRAITDLAAEVDAGRLNPILDRALANRIVTLDGLEREIDRRSQRGRKGPGQLRRLLTERGLSGGPAASVLEAEAMRMFRAWDVPVLSRETQAGPGGRYRIDFVLGPKLAVEVDGYAYHWSPEDKAYDDARRNRLRADGWTVLVYDWRAVRFEPARVIADIRRALAA
jgi:very-short-patch-repair endonuclease